MHGTERIFLHNTTDVVPLGGLKGPFETFLLAKEDAIAYHKGTIETARMALIDVKGMTLPKRMYEKEEAKEPATANG